MNALLLPLEGIWSSIYSLMSAMIQPLYWAVSGLVVMFYRLWLPVTGHSGWAWTLAIVSLTVLIRTLLIPLFVKQINSARNMQLLQPKIKELQEKYGHDRNLVGQKTMELYKEEGVNPAASCLPILLQIPIFLALFRVLEGVANNRVRGHFFKANPDLVDSLQNAKIFGAGLAQKIFPFSSIGPDQIVGAILVVLMVVALFITQLQLMRKNMPPEALVGPMAQQQKMMLYLFPVIYAFSGTVLPIGVLLYWLTTNLWTMGQQYILIRNNPAPNTPAYILWEERMRAKGKDPEEIARQKALKRRKTVRSTPPVATIPASEDGQSKPAIPRQKVERQTVVRADKTKINRQQPVRKTRSARKKKK